MKNNKSLLIFTLLMLILLVVVFVLPRTPTSRASLFVKAYPDFFTKVDGNYLICKNGAKMIFDDGIENKSFDELLNNADLEDQISQNYPLGNLSTEPNINHDPGRIRYEPMFYKMYGNTKEEVERNLVTITWLPKTLNIKLQVTKINGIASILEQISKELDELPQFKKYLENPGGTFSWRNIEGTNRVSTHSFGATIDINVEYSDYWLWDEKKTGSFKYKNRIPNEIVKIFEKHGFIWGGKWYHYDTMHFEYRPELLL